MTFSWIDLCQLAGFALGLAGQWMVGRRNRNAFAVWAASNVFLCALNLAMGLYVVAMLFAIYLFMCLHNYALWGKDEDTLRLSHEEAVFLKGMLDTRRFLRRIDTGPIGHHPRDGADEIEDRIARRLALRGGRPPAPRARTDSL